MIDTKDFILYSKNEPYNEAEFCDNLRKLVSVVINRYYKYNDDREDLESEAYVECLKLLRAPNFDPTNRVLNYLFTGIRNRITNFLYSITSRPVILVEDFNYYEGIESSFIDETHVNNISFDESWIDGLFGSCSDHYKGIYLFKIFQRCD